MKLRVQTEPDFDYEVIDVFLYVDEEKAHIRGFDDWEWKEANEFAETLSNTIGCPILYDIETKGVNNGSMLQHDPLESSDSTFLLH
jgi:uncharacterized protein YbjT (DUF2867 family)